MKRDYIDPFFATLQAANPEPRTELEYTTPFELLAAVLMSAQATDVSVNKVTRMLYPVANTPEKILKLGLPKLENHIKTIGLFRSKAKNLMETCRILVEQHGGEVPRTREELEALPGVGRKTANVVLNVVFGEPTMAVDTHILRIGNRTGLAPGKTPLEVELKLHGKVWPVPRLIYPIDDVRLTPPFKTTATKTFTILTWEKKGSTPWLRGFRADPPRCRLELSDPPTEREFTNESVERRYLVRVEGESVGLEDSLQVISVIPEFDPPMADTRPFRVLIESRSQIRAIPSVINVSVKSLPLKRQILITSEAADWTCTPSKNWPAWLRLVELVDVSSPSQKTYRCTVELLSDARSQHSTAVLSFNIRDGDVEAVTIPVHIVEN